MKMLRTVGIVGAGTMGQGIAQVCAVAGLRVRLFDAQPGAVKRAHDRVAADLQKLTDRGKLTAEGQQRALSNLEESNRLQEVVADIVIEAALEELTVKKEIFHQLENVNSTDALLVTNTSSIPVTRIASSLAHPQRFAGLHFFNPAPVMKLVEVIAGAATSTDTVNTLYDFALQLGKVPVHAKDAPGFIVNRVARHYYVEALRLVEEGVADLATVDELMRMSGFKMGPFELMDLIGVDTNFSVTCSMYEAFHQDPKFRPSRLQQQKVDAGHHGRKTGQGFYSYPANS
jgi:3-hydroxybutyryl-CoA dehydrogenase